MYFTQNYIKENGVRVIKTFMEKTRGVALERNGKMNIVLADDMDEIEERETLAHEVGHIIDGTVDTHICLLSERSAHKSGRTVMIPYDKFIDAIRDMGECDLTILAKRFGCSYEYMEQRFRDLYPQYL